MKIDALAMTWVYLGGQMLRKKRSSKAYKLLCILNTWDWRWVASNVNRKMFTRPPGIHIHLQCVTTFQVFYTQSREEISSVSPEQSLINGNREVECLRLPCLPLDGWEALGADQFL